MANGLAVAERRRILSAGEVDQSLDHIERLVAQSFETDGTILSASHASELARSFGLSAYDAVYFNLAQRERLPLATLDERLKAAASQAGFALVR